jgi:hypothetical protein
LARTYEQIRQLTAKQTGLKFVTGTSDSGGGTTVLTDAALTRYANHEFDGHHLLLLTGSPIYTELFITDFFQNEGDVQFRPEEGAAPDDLNYEILPFSGTDFLRAIQDSILILYDEGVLSRNFNMGMVGGSPIYNADFSYWTSSSVVDGWTATSSTVGRERASSNLALSETSVQLSGSSGHLDLDAKWQRYLNDFKGDSITLYCMVKTSTASNARIAIYDGSTINYSAYHGGDGDWELLSVEVATTDTDTEFEPRLYMDNAASAYYNMPWLKGGTRATAYPFPHEIMPDGPISMQAVRIDVNESEIAAGRGFQKIRQHEIGYRNVTGYKTNKHHDENTTTQLGIIDFSSSRRPPTDELFLMLRGDGPLTVPTSALSTDNIEVTESESMLLATTAAIILLEKASSGAPASTRRTYEQRITELEQQAGRLSVGAGEARDVATYGIGW